MTSKNMGDVRGMRRVLLFVTDNFSGLIKGKFKMSMHQLSRPDICCLFAGFSCMSDFSDEWHGITIMGLYIGIVKNPLPIK